MPILRLFWFLAKLGLLIAALLWIAGRPGDVSIHWFNYSIDMPAGLLAALFLLGFVFLLGLYRLVRWARLLPYRLSRQREQRNWKRAKNTVLLALMAQQMGDNKNAAQYLRQIRPLLKEDPLLQLLEAQTAWRNGETAQAEENFRLLEKQKSTRQMGSLGLMRIALKNGDEENAWRKAESLLDAPSLPPEVARVIFTQALHRKEWKVAEHVLRFLKEDRSLLDTALLTEQAREALKEEKCGEARSFAKAALKKQAGFLPAIQVHFEALLKMGKKSRAEKYLKAEWTRTPHPLFISLFNDWTEDKDSLARASLAKEFIQLNPHHPVSLALGAQTHLAAQLWGEARRYLAELAEREDHEGTPSVDTCALYAELEERQNHLEAAREWLHKLRFARPASDWHCLSCGQKCAGWQIQCPHCEMVATIQWMEPMGQGLQPLTSARLPAPKT